MKTENTFSQLKKWLRNPCSDKAGLAATLGYRTTSTIDQWVHRGYIPERQEERVKKYLKGGKRVSQSKA